MGNINPRKVDVSNKFVSNYKNSYDCQYFGQKNGFVKNIDLRKINAPDKSVSDESYNALKKEVKDLKETIKLLVEKNGDLLDKKVKMSGESNKKEDISTKEVSNKQDETDNRKMEMSGGEVKGVEMSGDSSAKPEVTNVKKVEMPGGIEETNIKQDEKDETDELIISIDILIMLCILLCNVSFFPLFFLLLILFNVGKNTLIEPLLLFKYKFSQMIKCIYHKCKKARFRIKIRSRSYKALRKRFKCI